MRIGLLTTSFPRFEGDIAGTFVLGFARALVAQGHSVRVLAPEPREEQTAPAWPGIETRYVPYMRPRSLARTFYGAGVLDNARDPRAWPGLVSFTPALVLAATRELADCDALVSHFGLPCGVVAAAVRANRPHLAVLHSADLHLLKLLPGSALLARALVLGADHVTCVSNAHREKLLSLLPRAVAERIASRVHVQPMGVELSALGVVSDPQAREQSRQQARAAFGLDRFTLLTLARLVPVKGLCEALEVLRERADLEWVIAGDGPLRAELERRAAQLPRPGLRVRLVGEVRGRTKNQWLAAADAFLLPSRVLPGGRSEGAPHAVLEAMAVGLPVLASHVGGIRELVRDRQTGLLFDPHAPETLCGVLDTLTSDPALAQSLADEAQRAAKAYDWTAIGPRFVGWLS